MIGKKAGQAAMEYLMTYGWALLVIVIVIAILLIMNPFSSPQSCKFDSIGFACENIAVKATDGTLLGGITNGNNNGITVKGIVCTKAKGTTAPPAPTTVTSTPVARQGSYAIPATVKCDSTGPAGGEFSGKVWIFYKNDEDTLAYPNRTASATLTTKFI